MVLRNILSCVLLLLSFSIIAQNGPQDYEPSKDFPYGRANPEAPDQLKDFAPLIGTCNCKSETRNKDKSWAKPIDMIWKFKYIMNGKAVQDETLKADGKHSGSIRQYSQDSARWYVHYYSSAGITAQLSAWEGNKKGEDIVLYREQKAPNGMDGYYRITFANISNDGFNWIGEWVTRDESFSYPTWKITCIKRKE